MNVLHITRDFPPRSTGGLSTAVGEMVEALAGCGVSSSVLSFDAWRPRSRRAGAIGREATVEQSLGAMVIRVDAPSMIGSARTLVRERRPDVLHVHVDMAWELAAELRRELVVPAVASVHVAQLRQNRLRGIIELTASLRGQTALLREADRVIAPSEAAADAAREHVPAVSERLVVVPLAIAERAWARDATAHPERRDPSLIAHVGRFSDINGTAELWQALRVVLERHPEARAVVAGGVPENRRAEARWIARWQEVGGPVAGRVELVGWQTAAELADLYSRAGVVVSASWFETFGLVLLEAMMAGTPIVATRSGGAEALLQNGASARLCPPRDAAALADAVDELMRDRQLALRLGHSAAARARERFWAPAIALALRTVYERTASGTG
jgi:glycosyltransferase involved in cell wall biosynthesis